MVWHGGISGSSLIKAAEVGHLSDLMSGIYTSDQIATLPVQVPFSETVFSSMNLTANLSLLILLPLLMYWIGKRSSSHPYQLVHSQEAVEQEKPVGADKLDHSKIFGIGLGLICLVVSAYNAAIDPHFSDLGFITPNWINLLLLGLVLLLHAQFVSFLKAINEAIGGAAGILIQFPIYFGIMGLMRSSGMVEDMAQWFVEHSNPTTYPLFTFLSAGLVNIFVPSGGGQWAIQGPIIINAANDLGVSLSKSILAMAYGDQLTNMLQPFWALPLLGITQLKAKAILPYTLTLMAVGGVVFVLALLLL